MIKRIKKYFEDRRNKQIEDYLSKKAEAEAIEAAKIKEAVDKVLKEQSEAIKTAEEPWIKLESGELHPEHGIQLKLDWNGAFIDYLKKECGFSGPDDEAIIQKYIGAVYQDIYESGNNDRLITLSEKFKE